MWILIRLCILLAGFFVRYANIFRKRFKFTDKLESGAEYGTHIVKGKHAIVLYCMGTAFETDVVFEIAEENKKHRFLKEAGFASEIQTGDIEFDNKYYIGSDHFHFNQAVRDDRELRSLIHDLLTQHSPAKKIVCDGRSIYLEAPNVINDLVPAAEKLSKLADKMKPIAQTSKFQAYKDPFIAKLLIFESILFALGAYAFEAFFEHMMSDQYSLHSPYVAYLPGTLLGLVIVGVIFGAALKYFRESARIHFIFIGNLIVLLIGVPFWGTKTFIDLNHQLDRSPVVTQTLHINKKTVQVHRSSKGGRSYTYYWNCSDLQLNTNSTIKVQSNVYSTAEEGDSVEIKSRKGAFNFPYWVSINNIEL